MDINELLALEESQTFERKSIQIKATDLSQHLCAFANADGGTIAIGISDGSCRIEGVDDAQEKVNDLLRAAVDYCRPSVRVITELVPCLDRLGHSNHVLLLHIEASSSLHANQQDEVFLRVGDKSKKLSFEDRLALMYDKGLRLFEDTIVDGSGLQDIDFVFLNDYLRKIGYSKSAEEYLLQNKNFARRVNGQIRLSAAAVLLFAEKPQRFFPRARIRFIRYEGCEARTGAAMNVIKDILFEGSILKQTRNAIAFLQTQIRERTYLGANGVFQTESEYPEFVLTELIVNAVTHRDYSITGTDIQIKMFDDRIEVDSPGRLPGLVKPDNIRYTHFSRNPNIAEFMKWYEYVKEYGEGIDRIYQELEVHGLPPLKINNDVFVLRLTAYNRDHIAEAQTAKPEVQTAKPEVQTAKPEAQTAKPEVQTAKPEMGKLTDRLRSRNARTNTIRNVETLFQKRGFKSFSSGDITVILNRSQSAASEMIRNLLYKYEIIEPSPDGRKNFYRFKLL